MVLGVFEEMIGAEQNGWCLGGVQVDAREVCRRCLGVMTGAEWRWLCLKEMSGGEWCWPCLKKMSGGKWCWLCLKEMSGAEQIWWCLKEMICQ